MECHFYLFLYVSLGPFLNYISARIIVIFDNNHKNIPRAPYRRAIRGTFSHPHRKSE